MSMETGTITGTGESTVIAFKDAALIQITGVGWSGAVKAQIKEITEVSYVDLPDGSFTGNAIYNMNLVGNWHLKLVGATVTGTLDYKIGQRSMPHN